MPAIHEEIACEAAIEHNHATSAGYTHGDNRNCDASDSDTAKSPLGYDREAAIFPGVFIAFVKATHLKTYQASPCSTAPASRHHYRRLAEGVGRAGLVCGVVGRAGW